MRAPKHEQEDQRLEALCRYHILDTPQEPAFDDIANLASIICETPIAVVNLIDRERQWFKAEIGLGVRETPLDVSICAHAILQPGLFVVADTHNDARFACNPLVTGAPHLRFYAGALLESADGYPIGTLCVLDVRPRELTDKQQAALLALGRQVMALMELRLANERLHRSMTESHHRIKNSMQIISALVDMQVATDGDTVPKTEFQRVSQHIRGLANIHDLLTRQAKSDTLADRLSASDALNKLLPALQSLLQGRRLNIRVADIGLTVKQATSLTLLVSELVSNAVKHGGQGDVDITLAVKRAGEKETDAIPEAEIEEETICLEVADRGTGFPADFDAAASANTGLSLIESLARWDLKGDIAYMNRPDGGGRVVVTFPLQA